MQHFEMHIQNVSIITFFEIFFVTKILMLICSCKNKIRNVALRTTKSHLKLGEGTTSGAEKAFMFSF